jgi:hypothetical protein
LALLETGFWESDAAAISTGALSPPRMLSRPRMLAAVAPTTRKHVSAMIVVTRVKQLSVSLRQPDHFHDNWELIMA